MIEGRAQPIGAAMIAERNIFCRWPRMVLIWPRYIFQTINGSGCAKALTNFYSVPLPVGTAVEVKVYSAYVEVWHQGEVRSAARALL